MLTQKEMRERFAMLYDYMATSNNPAYMKVFGGVMKEMMEHEIEHRPETAEEWIEELCSIKWRNYLSQKEAEQIVSAMNPKAPWPRSVWKSAMERLGLVLEEEPYYNSCALWVTMNMVYSDSAQTIADIIGSPLTTIPEERIVKAVHALAIDKLKDSDHVFSIRRYFGL